MTPDRIPVIDAVRGVAVMGILLMNVVAFGLPFAAYSSPVALGPPSLADLWTWVIAFVLIDGKMRALFSFLFGASMLLVIDRATASGRSPAATHYARMASLFLFGLAHFVLLWFGDILMLYAIIGGIAFLFSAGTPQQLVRWGVSLCLVSTIIGLSMALGLWTLRHHAMQAGASPQALRAWQSALSDFAAPSASALAREIAIARGSWPGMVIDRIANHSADTLDIIQFSGIETLGLMLLGMAGLRSGFIAGDWDRARYLRWALTAYAIGLPPTILIVALAWHAGFGPLAMFLAGFVASPPFQPVIMIGHASAILWMLKGARGWLPVHLAATGRMAFSNYLGTSLLMTTLFYGYGFGLFGRLDRWQLYLIVPAIWLLMLLWSEPWLDRFAFGPMEWLWRSVARWQWQPMRR
jgi:uncharacterized protein